MPTSKRRGRAHGRAIVKRAQQQPLIGREVRAWFRSTYGSAWLTLEKRQIESVMPLMVGTRLLQVGNWGRGDELLRSSRLLQHWVIGLVDGLGADAITDGTALPVLSRSVDAVVLPHALELVGSPEALVGESERALVDHGQLVITGFNPLSGWGVKRALKARREGGFPWQSQPLTLLRLRLLLDSHGFDVVRVRRYGLGFPRLCGDRKTDLARPIDFACRGLSNAYLVVARKRVAPLTPIGRVWRPAPKLNPASLPCRAAARTRAGREPA